MSPAALWTDAELAVVREHYPRGGAAAVQAAGVKRGRMAIQKRAWKLGVRGPTGKGYRADPASAYRPLMRPHYPHRTALRLHALAETPGLTEREYEARKAAILAEEA